MAAPWGEYIRTAEKHIRKIERLIERLKTGFRSVKIRTEQETRASLRQWLKGAPKKEREAANAFLMISSFTSLIPAFDAIDKAFERIRGLAIVQPVTAPVTQRPEDIQNIYGSQALMREESLIMLDDLDVPAPTQNEQNVVLLGVASDNRLNIIGIITRDGRRIKEEMQRSVTSELPVASINQEITDWHINPSYYDSSTLAHPRASVRGLIASAAEQATALDLLGYNKFKDHVWTVLPTSDSVRVEELLAYNLFTTKELDALFKKESKGKQTNADWRGLGLGFNTNEYYIPLHKEHIGDAEKWSKKQRSKIRDAS